MDLAVLYLVVYVATVAAFLSALAVILPDAEPMR